ncbi:MAG: 4Fe-4S binding protein [Polyangiales bacterium]
MSFQITDKCSGCAACVQMCPAGAIQGDPWTLYEIDPARCVDCGACGVVCREEAVRDARGETFSLFEAPRGRRAFVDLSRCVGCGWCVDTCVFDALRVVSAPVEGAEALTFVAVNPARCTACEVCVLECGDAAVRVLRVGDPEADALQAQNAELLARRGALPRGVS